MKPLKQKISITLDNDIIEPLRELADDCDRSLSQYINLVMRDHLKNLPSDETISKQQTPKAK